MVFYTFWKFIFILSLMKRCYGFQQTIKHNYNGEANIHTNAYVYGHVHAHASIPRSFEQKNKNNIGTTLYFSSSSSSSSSPDASELAQQKYESIQSFSNYNNGKWICKNPIAFIPQAKSDVAAGIYQQRTILEYESICSTKLDSNGLFMTELLSWKDKDKDEDDNVIVYTRQVPLDKSMDIDSVDGSYSLDSSCSSSTLFDLPSALTGTDGLVKFSIEKCLAISDDERIRLFVLYDMDDCFMRLILCNEERQVLENNYNDDYDYDDNDMKTDIDRLVSKITGESSSTTITSQSTAEDRMEQLIRAMDQRNSNIMNDNDNASTNKNKEEKEEKDDDVIVERSPMTLFSLVSGVWLGDMVIRNHPIVYPTTKTSQIKKNKSRGFGVDVDVDVDVDVGKSKSKSKSKTNSKSSLPKPGAGMDDGFAEWDTGVQKIAMTYRWDYDKTVRQRMDVGRSMGVGISEDMPMISNGNVITNYMARGKKAEERLVSIDVDDGAYIALITGSVLIKVPRLLSFTEKVGTKQPFVTELAVFQKRTQKKQDMNSPNTDKVTMDSIDKQMETPELFCSRLTRMYGTKGELLQCTSSFFSLDRSAI